MTMQTKPLSPSRTTSYPDAVNTLIVARSEMYKGAALRASATSAARGIRYSERGGYFEFSARATDEPINEGSKAVSNISVLFPMFGLAFSGFHSAQRCTRKHLSDVLCLGPTAAGLERVRF